jgi:predicted aspartyl protease
MIRGYDDVDYNPPAPVLDVLLSAPGDLDIRVAEVALVDTGADVSVLAVGLASHLGLPLVGTTEVAGVDDQAQFVRVWRVNFDIPGLGRFGAEAVELGSTTIIGRDILNRLSLHLDGPKEQLRSGL